MHYMQAEARGVRVWHIANIGSGRLLEWSEIKKHHHGNTVVDPCVPLIHVPAAIDPNRAADKSMVVASNEFEPKIHRSHRNVKARKKLKELRAADKARTRELKHRQSVRELLIRFEEGNSLRCQWCSAVMSSLKALTKHQQCGCTRTRGKAAVAAAAAAAAETNIGPASQPMPTPSNAHVTTPDEASDHAVETLPLGYAWKALRDHVTETVSERARAILEQAFLRGEAKGGDRRSCFQMEETVAGRLPVEERVSRYTIQTWLSNRLKQEKDNNNPKIVRKRAIASERKKLLVEAWGFDTFSMTKTQIVEHLQSPGIGCTVRNRHNPTGDFQLSSKKSVLLQLLHSKLQVPATYANVDIFIADVQSKSQDAGKRAVLAMSTTGHTGNPFPHPLPYYLLPSVSLLL